MCPLPHPTQQRLSEYVSGKLSQDEASSVAQHLNECRECESTIEAMEAKSETMISGLSARPAPDPYEGESELRRAVANVTKLPGGAPAAAPQPAAEKVSTKGPVKLGPYQLLAKLGEGGMGAVFKARHEHLDKLVAIKVLPKKAMQDAAAVARFRREMKAVGALHHPNIVGAHDAGEQQGVHFLVMEYAEGSDLSSLIKKNGPVSVEQAVSYMQQAAKGLAFAHGKGIVHRDIKPANLLVDGEGTVKILDMGLARLDDGSAANAEANQGLTQTGQVMGTVDYMAPEQAFDTHRADAKADVYSLGCTLYRILTGQNAYSGDTVVQKILAHREHPIPSLLKIRAEAPAALDALYQRMLAKRPEDRPTMAEVAKDLEALQKGVGSREQGVAEAGPAIVVDMHKAATGGRGPVARRETKPIAKPQPSGTGRKPPKKALVAAAAAGAFALVALGIWIVVRNDRDEVVAKVNAPPGTRIEVPPGGSVEVVSGEAPLPVASAAVASPPPTFFTPGTQTIASPASPPGDYALHFGDGASVEVPSLSAALDPAGPLTVECWVTPGYYVSGEVEQPGSPLVKYDGEVPVLGFSASPPFNICLSNSGGFDFRLYTTEVLKGDGRAGQPPLVVAEKGERGGKYLYVGGGGSAVAKHRPIHLACVRSRGKAQFYVAGKLHESKDLPPITLAKPELPFAIGGRQKNTDRYFHGVINEVRISKTVRYDKDFTPQLRFEPDADTTALFHFDEAAGNVLRDASGNQHDGKIVDATWVRADGSAIPSPIATSSGKYAIRFENKQGIVLPFDFDPSQPFTVEGEILNAEGGGGWAFIIQDRVSLALGRVAFNLDGSKSGKWNAHSLLSGFHPVGLVHYACVFDAKTMRLFMDGKLVASEDVTGDPPTSGPGKFLLANKTTGLMRNVRISKVARYDRDFTPAERHEPDADTLALYRFDEGSGDVLYDASGHGYDVPIIGATWVRADGSAITAPVRPGYAAGSSVDLFQRIVPERGGIDNKDRPLWQWTPERHLQCNTGNKNVALPIDVSVPAAYAFEMDVMPMATEDAERRMSVGLRAGEQRFTLTLHAPNPQTSELWSGLADINNRGPSANGTGTRGIILAGGKVQRVRVEVRSNSVTVAVDGKRIVDYRGPLDRLSLPFQTTTINGVDVGKADLWLMVHSRTQFHSLTLTPLAGAPTPTIATGSNYALSMDGPDDKIDVASVLIDGRKPWTYEAWVTPRKPLDAGGRNSLVLMVDPVWLGVHVGGPDKLNWTAGGPTSRPGSTRFAAGKVQMNKRVHLALVRNTDGVSLYVDGVVQGEPLPIVFLSPQSWIRIRPLGNPAVKDVPFHGDFDEVRLSTTARYSQNFTPAQRFETDSDTVALYHFDEGAGEVLRDSSGNKRDGRITGAKWVRADGTPVSQADAGSPDDGEWTELFNGRDLSGWKHPASGAGWIVEEGALVCSGGRSYLVSERGDFRDFHCRMEVMINSTGNGGLFFRCPPTVPIEQGYEAQISNFGKELNGGLYRLPGAATNRWGTGPAVANDAWYTIDVIAVGNKLTTKVNGQTVVDIEDAAGPVAAGHLALQHGDDKTRFAVRSIRIRDFSAKKSAPAGNSSGTATPAVPVQSKGS